MGRRGDAPPFFFSMRLVDRLRHPSLAIAGALCVPFWLAARAAGADLGAEKPFDVQYVPHGGALSRLAPGWKLSLANYYWLLTVQYLGDSRADQRGYEKLFPLADLVTDLDPKHGYAYQSAGIVLSTRGLLDDSDRILKKGMERGPNWWTYPFYLAFNDFFYRGNYAAAADWAEVAARTPGASTNVSHLALAMKSKSGAPEDAVRLLDEMRRVAADEKTRSALDEQYKLALAQVNFARLDEALEAFRARHRRTPARIAELVEGGVIAAIPPEPFGGRYELRADGRVHSTGKDFRFAPAEAWRAKFVNPSAAAGPPTPLLPVPLGGGK